MSKEASQRLLEALQRHHPERCCLQSNIKAAPAFLTADAVAATLQPYQAAFLKIIGVDTADRPDMSMLDLRGKHGVVTIDEYANFSDIENG